MASGFVDWASSRAISPREVIRPLKPIWWAISSRIEANLGSCSTIRRSRSPGRRSSRSPPTSICGMAGASAGGTVGGSPRRRRGVEVAAANAGGPRLARRRRGGRWAGGT